MSISIYLSSLGCEKNLMDSERALGAYLGQGFKAVSDPRQAEVIMVNTCGFITPAVEEGLERIAFLARFKQMGICKYLIVSGCLSQRYAQELPKEFPEVDLFMGTRDYHRLNEVISTIQSGQGFSERVWMTAPFVRREQPTHPTPPQALQWEDALPRAPSGLTHTGYVKISEGCNKRCTFCTIPLIRGDLVSRPMHSVVEEIQFLESQGLQEVHLIAQDLNDYGLEWENGPTLETLIEEILAQTEVSWIRLHYLYPDRISDRLIELMASERRLCRYMDMPIQHISDAVLKRMGRKHTQKQTLAILDRIKHRIPDMGMRTTLITGFPGETEAHHQELLAFLRAGWFEHVGVFPYYHEASSASYQWEDDVPSTEKKRRKKDLELCQSQVMRQVFSTKYLNTTQTCLVDGPHPDSPYLLKARMATQALGVDSHVIINEGSARQGQFVQVALTRLRGPHLMGRI
jgi:ribosomal protein S12 methylthiotransferase